VGVDSTEPDLDYGTIGRSRYGWLEEQFAVPARFRIFMLHHHLLPIPGTGRERNMVYDAGDTLEVLQRCNVNLVLSGHKHVPHAWHFENMFVVNAGTVCTLRLRGDTRPCYNIVTIDDDFVRIERKYPFHGTETIIEFSPSTLHYQKFVGRPEERRLDT
jgi:3',5'-cyclic AMP phosphodiesterase CpdA